MCGHFWKILAAVIATICTGGVSGSCRAGGNLYVSKVKDFNTDVTAEDNACVSFIFIICPENDPKAHNIQDLHRFPNIQSLDILHCNISKLESGVFSAFPNLLELQLYKTSINEINADAFQGLTRLFKLKMDHNNYTKLSNESFRGLENLKKLILVENKFDLITPDALRLLKESNNFDEDSKNYVTSVVFSHVIELQDLDLSSNMINIIRKGVLDHLSRLNGKLDLSNNGITIIKDFAFSNLVKLVSLNLGNNSITILGEHTFDGLVKLETLELYLNNIEEIHPLAFRSLLAVRDINLQNNKIKILHPYMFQTNSRLFYLSLYSNQIEVVTPEMFSGLEYCRVLLKENNITSFPAGTKFKPQATITMDFPKH